MASVNGKKVAGETVREWCAPEKGQKMVTRNELMFWFPEWERLRRRARWHSRLGRWIGAKLRPVKIALGDALAWLVSKATLTKGV